MMYEKKNYQHLLGVDGMSDALLNNHFTLYEGYVANTNKVAELLRSHEASTPEYAELKRRFGWEFNGMRLHEYYFGNITKERENAEAAPELVRAIEKEWGDIETWEHDFKATGALRGIGWVVLAHDPIASRLFNIWINEHDLGMLAGTVPILVMDVFEHAFMLDYGLRRGDYIAAFWNALKWSELERRFNK